MNENNFDPEEQVYYVDTEGSLTSNDLNGKSNEDYYKKIEKLKNAYIHSMAKLEKLYRNKLHVRDDIIDSEDLREIPVCYSSTYELTTDRKNDAHLSYSTLEFEVESTASLSLSDSSTDDQEVCGENFTSHGRNQIQRMWDGFSVEMYTLYDKPQKLGSSNLLKAKVIKKEQKHWSPKITIPQPFQMTIREVEKKQRKNRSRSEIEVENYMLSKRLEEEAECQKNFHANPVPAHTYIPLMEEIMERNEERRKFAKAKSKEILLAIQKPFAFLEREEKKKEVRKMQIKDLDLLIKKRKTFKAKPVPKYLHDQKVIDRIKEEELYRAIRMKVRAQELLNSASLPKSMLSNATCKRRKRVCYEPEKELKFKPKINAKVPDFEMLHRKAQRQLMKNKMKLTTIGEPFQMHVFSNEKFMDNTIEDETDLKEVHWPFMSSIKQSKSHSSVNSTPSESLDLEIIRSTEESKKKKAIGNRERKHTKCYLLEFKEMHERENTRPLLQKVLTQRNARRSAKKYTAAQKERGLKEDFVFQQGHSALHSNNRESVKNEDNNCVNEESSQEEDYGLDFEDDNEDEESTVAEEYQDRM
ncbi:protein FAM161A isoform X2 [Hypanus sabinus]|uniref:protein FAM161A isoform X2 n=1 Tax=Hypanus sabinus TaxID=79690 RepID=UPI0028C3E9F2|nr:protein FAM161A isoform X2 [Hypanus sabinus]